MPTESAACLSVLNQSTTTVPPGTGELATVLLRGETSKVCGEKFSSPCKALVLRTRVQPLAFSHWRSHHKGIKAKRLSQATQP